MAPAPKKKAIKIGRALKRLPARAVGRGNSAGAFAPIPGEQPIVILRVQVLSGTNLLAKDRNGSSDPFVVVSLLGTKHQTPVSKRTVNPTYNPKDPTFDFLIYLSLADKLGVVELVVWDKDMLKKDYLGEAWIPKEDWFRDGNAFAFDDMNNKVCLRSPRVFALPLTFLGDALRAKPVCRRDCGLTDQHSYIQFI
ncbi:C2-domain-containing protein [Lentinus tigrinus ALCF2SS1-6]|uniref:C2-domain-containing protein n=1 Tax=Lentinus tigrinus ALCF2SS1-6 TaxID=1328759 RepID=A0A5C2RNF0_9APHY|nr:C2-domain-containing protein [Lentinus tigrinus ALCF2SS1-6]